METSEFKSNGTVLVDDYELVNGACILNSPNEPGLTIVIKWKKLADNSYELFFVANGVESPVKQSFTTAFSNGNNTVTVTTTEQDGSLVNSVLERL